MGRSQLTNFAEVKVKDYSYRILNVFAESTFGGNPLCVFENAEGMSDVIMSLLAAQFNLSESAFLLPSETADARVRIFTRDQEIPFAGYPILGSAYIARMLCRSGTSLALECGAGRISVRQKDDLWTFSVPTNIKGEESIWDRSEGDVVSLFNLDPDDLLEQPVWVNAGAQHLMVPLRSAEALQRARPLQKYLETWPVNSLGRKTAYLFAYAQNSKNQIFARHFNMRSDGLVVEEAATGSACANLGKWILARDPDYPENIKVLQGLEIGRMGHLHLTLDSPKGIHVGGRVVEIGRGVVNV